MGIFSKSSCNFKTSPLLNHSLISLEQIKEGQRYRGELAVERRDTFRVWDGA